MTSAEPAAPFGLDVEGLIAAPMAASAHLPMDPQRAGHLDAVAHDAFGACAGTPGAIVGVRTPNGTWTEAYGHADPSQRTPMATDAHLRIGSVTKTFVGTVVLQLVQEGVLSLDATIDGFVDGVPNGDRISLALLLAMRSGIVNYLASAALIGRVLANPSTPFTADELIESGLSLSPSFDPDERFDYSNTNYTLLGKVVERATGQNIGDLIAERVTGPLGLAHTSWPDTSTEMPAPFARGFTRSVPSATPGQPTDTTNWNPSWAGAAGAIISTVDDLLTYGRAVVTGQQLLDERMQALRLRSFRPAPALGPNVAYGFALMSIDRWIGHSGDIPGYRAAMYHEPSSDTTLVVLTSSDIMAGRCPEPIAATAVASDADCKAPTARIFDDVATALGIPTSTPHPT